MYDVPSGIYADNYEKDMSIIRTKMQWGILVLFLIFLFVIPNIPGLNSAYVLRLLIGISITVIACLGLNILTGYCGQLNIGQSAFMMVGAFTSGLLNLYLGWPFWACVIPAGLLAAFFGAVFGAPSVRLKGLYLALTTLGAQIILTWAFLTFIRVGSSGFDIDPPKVGNIVFDTPQKFYYLAMFFTVGMVLVTKNIVRSGLGRVFVAIRDNDIAAEAMGINIFHYKLLAFMICTFYAGVAGSLLAHYMMFIHVETFSLLDSIYYVAMIIVGGLGTVAGTVLGVVFLTALKELTLAIGPLVGKLPFMAVGAGSGLLLVVTGGLTILFLIFEPRGLAHRWNTIKSACRLWPFGY